MFDHPHFVSVQKFSRGPDPLGLQSSNMARYQSVFPGINNRARYIRVYSTICWMVRYIWNNLPEDADDDQIQSAFDFGLQKIQLLLIWENTRAEMPTLAGTDRQWPEEGVTEALTYRSMPTNEAAKKLHADEGAEIAAGATLLAPAEYRPSITRGFGLLERWIGYDDVFDFTDEAVPLADAYEDHLQKLVSDGKLKPTQLKWLKSLDDNKISSVKLDALWEALRLDNPTRDEKDAFILRFYPSAEDAVLPTSDIIARCRGLTFALRALELEEKAAGVENAYVAADAVRHTMARGHSAAGEFVPSEDLGETPLIWKNLQVRQLLKLALETLLRVTEYTIHHTLASGYELNDDGRRVGAPRSIDAIAMRVGELAAAQLEPHNHRPIEWFMHAIERERGAHECLYSAGIDAAHLDIRRNLRELRKAAQFTTTKGSAGSAAGKAFYALLWCAVESAHMQLDSRNGDRPSLLDIREVSLRSKSLEPTEYVALVVRDHVIAQLFDVARERTETELARGSAVVDRNRIVMGDGGLELNLASARALSDVSVLDDNLLHALYFLAQAGFVRQNDKGDFQLTPAGRKRAAAKLPWQETSLVFEETSEPA